MDFATTSDVGSDDVSAPEAKGSTKRDSKTVDARAFDVKTDSTRDERLTEFGKETLRDRYLLPGENISGSLRPRRLGLCRRSGPCPAGL